VDCHQQVDKQVIRHVKNKNTFVAHPYQNNWSYFMKSAAASSNATVPNSKTTALPVADEDIGLPDTSTSQTPTSKLVDDLNRNPHPLSASSVRPRSPSPMDRLVTAYDLRGLSRFHVQGGVQAASAALADTHKVMLLTGFSVDDGLPETDGPLGTAALGHVLKVLGKEVTYVADPTNTPILEAVLKSLNSEITPVITFDAEHGNAQNPANNLLDKYTPDAVIAIELPSRTENGTRHNMRGINIDGFNGPVDQIVIEANKRSSIKTVGVGDGGNEVGMGGLTGIPKALDGSLMAASVEVDFPVTAWNSNLGAEAIGAVMLAQAGELDQLHSQDQQTAMIQAALTAGAVDGVTRGSIAGEPSTDGKYITGVDGFSPRAHAGILEILKNIVSNETKIIPKPE
jgi:Domain of unknown function (DUF4392)